MQEGEKLPSVRAMASSLAINPNTIQRAYESLEAEGYVCSIAGKGSFVASHGGVDEKRKEELFHIFDQTTEELLFLEVSAQELYARIQELEGREEM
jgi:GntR family transcriptional regulator